MLAVRAAWSCPALRPPGAERVKLKVKESGAPAGASMGPKKRVAEKVDDGGGGASPKKKKGEKEAEQAKPADKAENTGKAKPAAKAPAEKIVIPKSELKTPSPPPSGRLFKVGAHACVFSCSQHPRTSPPG